MLQGVVQLTHAQSDQRMTSYRRASNAVGLDIDDSGDIVHGQRQLSLFDAHDDERFFLPIPVLRSPLC